MATFAYKVLDAKGAQATGQIDGDSKGAVSQTLRNRGFTVLDINEVKKGLAQIDILGGMQRIKAKDLTVFSRQFATMVNSGLSMLRCLYVLEEQTPNKKLVGGHRPGQGRRRGRHRARPTRSRSTPRSSASST